MANNLFIVDDQPLIFYLPHKMPEVLNMIRDGGGMIAMWPSCQSIWILNPELKDQVPPSLEVFSSGYIVDSFQRGKLQDLTNYRLTCVSGLNMNNECEVVLATEWRSQIESRETVLPNTNHRQGRESTSLLVSSKSSQNKSPETVLPNTIHREDSESSSISLENSLVMPRQTMAESDNDSGNDWFPAPALTKNPRLAKRRRKRGPDYTFRDELAILKYIKENNLHKKVKGVAMWKNMENDDILEGRTWQSLKNHFLRSMLPKIRSYEILRRDDIMKFM